MVEIAEHGSKEMVNVRKTSTSRLTLSIFSQADAIDYCLMAVGCVGAIADGVRLPIILFFSSMFFNDIGSNSNSPSLTINSINRTLSLFLCTAVASLGACFLEAYCWMRTAERQGSRMRVRYLRSLLRQEVGYFDLQGPSTSEIVTSVSSDSLAIQDVLSEKVPNFLMSCSHFVGGYIVAFILDWSFAVVAFPMAVLLIIPGMIYGRVLLGLVSKTLIEYNTANEIAEQAVFAIRTVYAFTAEQRTLAAFSSALKRTVHYGLRQGLIKGFAFGSTGIMFAIWAFMVRYGGHLTANKGSKGGNLYAAGLAIINGGIALRSGLSNVKYFVEAIAVAERMKEVIDRKPAIDSESREGEEIESLKGEVEYREVTFAYPTRAETEVLKGFSMRVPACRTVALVGGSGSGKSTAIALLQRFYNPASGKILLDGVEISRLRLKWLRSQMGLVSQEPALFATTIKENILFGKEDATLEEVIAATQAANAHDFISHLPWGYDTQVGEQGGQLSGGQKQRIAIARAIIRCPKILLLDEATSALDSESESIVQGAIDAASAGRTTIVIAHRLSTVRNADTIAFVHEGQVIESGTHDELLANPNSQYASLASLNKNTADGNMNYCSTLSPVTGQSFSSTPNARSFSASESAFDKGEEDLECKKVRQARPSFLRLLMLNAPEWPQAALGFTGCLLVGAVQPLYGCIMGSIVPIYFLEDHEEMMKKLNRYSMFMVALAVYSFLANVLQYYNLAAVGEYLTNRVREQMLSKVLTFELAWFDQAENSSGAICSKLAKDASVVRSLVGDRMGLIIQAMSAVTISVAMGLLFAWRLAAVMISMHPVLILSHYAKLLLLKRFSKMLLKAQSESSKVAAEAINNHRTVSAFSSQNRILQHFELAQAAPRKKGIGQSWLAGIGLGLSQCINHICAGAAFWYGGYLVLHGQISTPDQVRTLVILLGTAHIVADAGAMTSDLTKGAETVASVIDILDRATNIEPNGQNDLKEESINGDIVLSKVNFAYPTRPDVTVLRGFSLAIKAGRSTALVGPSGSGKSTVIGLIERFYDPIAGEVRIDGRNIKSYNLRSLRRHIALVGQEPALLGSTVRECITYGAEVGVTDAEVEASARVANAHGFISGLSNGYHTSLGERGAQLSGGQKQRIAIARAILRNPAILLLDEATSALDGKSEKVVQEALEAVMVGRTTVLVAHRLSIVRKCNQIAVLEHGVVVEKGKHASLMAKGSTGKYYNLVSLQTEESNISNQ